MDTFSNFTIQSNITSFNGSSFIQLIGFEMYSSCNISYYVTDKDSNKLYTLNDDWSFVAYKSFVSPAYIIKIYNEFYMTGDFNVWKLDENFNILIQYKVPVNSSYRGIYFNLTKSLLYVAPYNLKHIHVFDSNLSFNHSFPISPFQPFSIAENNNLLFVGTKNGTILVILDEVIINKFPGCNRNSKMLTFMLFDQYGYMATSCDTYQLYLYYSNGTFTNMSFSTPNETRQFGYDSSGRFFLVSFHQINVYN